MSHLHDPESDRQLSEDEELHPPPRCRWCGGTSWHIGADGFCSLSCEQDADRDEAANADAECELEQEALERDGKA